MEEIWYTLSGEISPGVIAEAIPWISGQIFQDPNVKRLKFFISSVGGDVDSAIRLHDYLKALPIEVTTIGFGQVDSAAVIIFLAGNTRIAIKKCRFLLHEGTYTFNKKTNALHVHEETMALFNELLRRNVEIIAKVTSKTKKQVSNLLRDGKILTSVKAKDLGIVTEISEKLPMDKPNPETSTGPEN